MKHHLFYLYTLVIATALIVHPATANESDTLPTPDTFTTTGPSDIAPFETAPDSVALSSPFQLISCTLHQKTVNLLDSCGIAYPSGNIIAMGFERPRYQPDTIFLALIALSNTNSPVKSLIPISATIYNLLHPAPRPTAPVAATPSVHTRSDSSSRNPQDGRLYFMINTTVRSLYVYPVGFATTMSNPDGQVVSGLTLLSLGASLYGSYAFSRSQKLGYGRVEFMNYGADMGGITIPLLLSLIDNSAPDNDKLRAYSAMFGFPLGIFLGSRFTFADNHAYGNASLMTNMSRIAPLYGFCIPEIFTADDFDITGDMTLSSILSLSFIPVGFYAGKLLTFGEEVSAGRSVITTTTGVLGGLTLPALLSLSESERYRAYFGLVLLGHAGGTLFGRTFKRTQKYSFPQGIFTTVSAIVGTGVGLSFPLLATADQHQAYTLCGLAGCWGGFFLGEYLSLSLFEKTAQDKERDSGLSISFPGLSSLPVMLAQQYVARRSSSNTQSRPARSHETVVPDVTLMDIRF